MTSIDERLLESKMTQIEQARAWSPRVISKFETLLRTGDEVTLYRANPLAFAHDRGVAELSICRLRRARWRFSFSALNLDACNLGYHSLLASSLWLQRR